MFDQRLLGHERHRTRESFEDNAGCLDFCVKVEACGRRYPSEAEIVASEDNNPLEPVVDLLGTALKGEKKFRQLWTVSDELDWLLSQGPGEHFPVKNRRRPPLVYQ